MFCLFSMQIKLKQEGISKDLSDADADVDDLETKRNDVKSMFEENRKKLPEAESEVEKAEDFAKQVNEVGRIFFAG